MDYPATQNTYGTSPFLPTFQLPEALKQQLGNLMQAYFKQGMSKDVLMKEMATVLRSSEYADNPTVTLLNRQMGSILSNYFGGGTPKEDTLNSMLGVVGKYVNVPSPSGATMPPGLNTLPIGPGGGGGQTIPTAPVYPTNQTPYGATPSSSSVSQGRETTLQQVKDRIARWEQMWRDGKMSEADFNTYKMQALERYFGQVETDQSLLYPSSPPPPAPITPTQPLPSTPTVPVSPSTYPNRVQPPKAAQPSAPTYPPTPSQPEGRPKKYQYPTYNRQPYGWLRKGNFSWW